MGAGTQDTSQGHLPQQRTWFQNREPSLRWFMSSTTVERPSLMASRSSAMADGSVSGPCMKRGFLPTTSAIVYPAQPAKTSIKTRRD
jgi:hypothetical protein